MAGLLALAGCADMAKLGGKSRAPNAATTTEITTDVPAAEAPPPPRGAVTVEQFDTTTAAERAEAAAAPPVSKEQRLGTTIASLGNPADPGFWAETGMVTAPVAGRLEYPATGKSVQVELRPSGGTPGSGTRVSLPAMRVLEAPLTGLPELVVFGG
jgi:hypothetical protein